MSATAPTPPTRRKASSHARQHRHVRTPRPPRQTAGGNRIRLAGDTEHLYLFDEHGDAVASRLAPGGVTGVGRPVWAPRHTGDVTEPW